MEAEEILKNRFKSDLLTFKKYRFGDMVEDFDAALEEVSERFAKDMLATLERNGFKVVKDHTTV